MGIDTAKVVNVGGFTSGSSSWTFTGTPSCSRRFALSIECSTWWKEPHGPGMPPPFPAFRSTRAGGDGLMFGTLRAAPARARSTARKLRRHRRTRAATRKGIPEHGEHDRGEPPVDGAGGFASVCGVVFFAPIEPEAAQTDFSAPHLRQATSSEDRVRLGEAACAVLARPISRPPR